MSTFNTFTVIYLTYTIFVHSNCTYRTDFLTRSNQICNSIIWTGFSTLTTFFTFFRIDISFISCHRNSTKLTCLHTFLAHTFLTVIGYNESCDRTLLTCRRDNLNDIVALFVTRTFSLHETDSLTDDLSLLVYTAAELCLRTRDQFERDIVSLFLESALKSQLGNCAQHVILDLKQCLIVGFHTISS